MKAKEAAKHTPGTQPVGVNWGNGLPAQRCAKCMTLYAPEIIVAPLGWCQVCVEPVRASAPDLLALVKRLDDVSEAYDLNTDKGRTACANDIRQLGFDARAAILRATEGK